MENFLAEIDFIGNVRLQANFNHQLHVIIKLFAKQIFLTSYLFTITYYLFILPFSCFFLCHIVY